MTYQDIVTAINLKHDELDALDDSNYGSPEYRRNELRHEIITKEILVLIQAKDILRFGNLLKDSPSVTNNQ